MDTKNCCDQKDIAQKVAKGEDSKQTKPADDNINAENKIKKKTYPHYFVFRSAVAHARGHAFRDVDFSHTGTNLTYRDE